MPCTPVQASWLPAHYHSGPKLGNKGGVAVRLQLGGTSICVVNMHLPAGDSDDAAVARDLAAQEVLELLGGGLSKEGYAEPLKHDLCVVLGDLNSRSHHNRDVALSLLSPRHVDGDALTATEVLATYSLLDHRFTRNLPAPAGWLAAAAATAR